MSVCVFDSWFDTKHTHFSLRSLGSCVLLLTHQVDRWRDESRKRSAVFTACTGGRLSLEVITFYIQNRSGPKHFD